MHEGTIHTELIPEIEKVLALPDLLDGRNVGELESIGRQLREYEQTFDALGYTLLEQLMPSTDVSPVFRIVRSADRFRQRVRARLGQQIGEGDNATAVHTEIVDSLSRHSLSIGTPPVTDAMRALVSQILFGCEVSRLTDFLEVLSCDRLQLERLLTLLETLVDSSTHYCTAEEEQVFLREAAEFLNFEGGRLFNRVVLTTTPERVIELLQRYVFDKFGPQGETPIRVVTGLDQLDASLVEQMRAQPNRVFVALVSRIPHRLFHLGRSRQQAWTGVLGRLILVDASRRARLSNTTIVYTLFPHVARALRDVQTSLAGRPAGSQLQLRRILEQISPSALAEIEAALSERLTALAATDRLQIDVDTVRSQEWTRSALTDFASLSKLRRLVRFVLSVVDDARPTPELIEPSAALVDLRKQVGDLWMSYFYRSLPRETYPATVVAGGGRGALALVGAFHAEHTRQAVDAFRRERLATCRLRLDELKQGLDIPTSSTDEIEAAIQQSQLRALSPTQWKRRDDEEASLAEHLSKTLLYRVADTAERLAQRARRGLDQAAYTNMTGGAAAFVKKQMSKAGFGALHGRLEDIVGDRVGSYDRRLRDIISPMQETIRQAQRSLSDLKGDMDPIAVSEIEAVLNLIEQDHFYPTLILPQMSWTYADVFPEKEFPAGCTIRIPLNKRHEMDPLALLGELEQLRYLFRRFPEIFELLCATMLIVLNTPHNPTGIVYRRETVLKLLQIAAEYDITVVDDNSYHKLLTREQKAREGDDCVAQLYESHRSQFSRPVRVITAGSTTKGLQGAGDRTGLLHANVTEVIDFAERQNTAPHALSLYLTQLKLESGLAAKGATREIERLATQMLDPTATEAPWQQLEKLCQQQLNTLDRDDFPVVVFDKLLQGYESILRLRQRGAMLPHLAQAVSDLAADIKCLRLERSLRSDIQNRIDQAKLAVMRAAPQGLPYITPQGAFYCCIRLCEADDARGVQEFLEAIADARKIDFTYAGNGYVRMSLGGRIAGDPASYDRLGKAIEVYTRLLFDYWARFDAAGRDSDALASIFGHSADETIEQTFDDLRPLYAAEQERQDQSTQQPLAGRRGHPIEASERGYVYCIEEGRSVADKVFVETERACDTVTELLQSQAFRVIYRRLLRKVYRQDPRFCELDANQVENQYGPLACATAYDDRQLIDELFRDLLTAMYRHWHGATTVKILAAHVQASRHPEKTAALRGVNRRLNELINELMFAFGIGDEVVTARSTFEVGYEVLCGIRPHPQLPQYLQRIVRDCPFAGATTALDPAPRFTTGAVKRVADYRYGFIRRDAIEANPQRKTPKLAYFQQRLAHLPKLARLSDYVCKAVLVGPFKMLLLMHKSYFHLISDELRLFPQIEAVQLKENLQQLSWDGVLLFGIPAKLVGDTYRTGYILDHCADGSVLPTAWVAREDATDYVGFVKKSLLTLHNERVKAMGGMPVHGAMITITFKNGLRKTLVFSADSGTGKSETITAMMQQMVSGGKLAAELDHIDILAGDMLSLWRGSDEQVYAFGTETGDFMRLTDITESWKEQFGDLLRRGSYSNLHFLKNPRVTIPGICDRRLVLTPTRVNGFFYINNYEAAQASAVELVEDPNQVLKQILVRGLRKNKGTSGDQPSLRAGLEFSGVGQQLVTRYRYALDQLLQWSTVDIEGKSRTCLVFRDGGDDVYAAKDIVSAAFRGRSFSRALDEDDKRETLHITGVHYDVRKNLFFVGCGGRRRFVLDREIYDQVYEPLVSTFCGNPFVDPEGMDRTLGTFAELMRAAKVHTGIIRTQLARPGYEFSGPCRAADDIVAFLLEDEEVNARFQRNKRKVNAAMQRTYAGVLQPGTNLPVELEGYNLLLLEEHESTHVSFVDGKRRFSIVTPYHGEQSQDQRGNFVPAIALPEHLATIADIASNPDCALFLDGLDLDLSQYQRIRYWNGLDELTYQVLLVNGVIALGSSETELARFPTEVRKAHHIAERIVDSRKPELGAKILELHA